MRRDRSDEERLLKAIRGDGPLDQAAEDEEELRKRFPDPNTDPRLRGTVELPPVPEMNFTRPNTRTAEGLSSGMGGKPGEFKNLGIASTIGFSLVGSIIAGTGLGWLADRYLLHSGGTPWGLIVGFFAGVLVGFINLVRTANRLNG